MLISPANTSQYITSGLKYYYSVINKRSCPNISGITSLIDLSGSGYTAGLASSSISTNNTIPCLNPYIYLNNSILILSPFSFEYFMYIIPGASNYILYMTDNSNQTVYIKINTDFSITLSINYTFVYTSPPYSIICYSWNHIIITYDISGNVNIYINNINVVNNNKSYTAISFNCYIAGQSAGISDGNSYFGYTRYYNKALTSTEVNTNYYYVQTLYRNAFPNIKSGGIINNLLINTLTYNSIAVTIYYTGFSTSTAATLVISLSATGSSPLSSYSPISTLGTSGTPSYTFGPSTNPAITLTQSQPYYVVLLLSGVSTFSRYFIVNTIGTFSAYGNTKSTYQSGSISFSQNTYPSGTITVTSDSGVTLNGTNSVQITLSRGSVPSPITYTVPGSTSPPTYYLYFSLDSTTSTNYGPVTPSSFAFTAYAQGGLTPTATASSYNSATLTWTYTGYPSTTALSITGNPSIGTINTTVGATPQSYNLTTLSANTSYTITYTITSTTYGNTAPTSSFSTYAQGTLNSFNITAYSSSGILLTWTYGNYSSGTSATITINNTSISQNVTLGQNSYQFPSSSLSSIMTNYGSVYTVTLSVNDTTYGNASISASSSIGGSYGFKIPNAYGSDSWYVGSLATSNDQGPYGNHSYYLVYLFTNVSTSFPSLTFYVAVSGSYDYLLIGGGGGGGPTKGGGGGGGGVIQGTVNLVASGNPCSVYVGGGGGSATDGSPTAFDYSPAGNPVSPGVYGTVQITAEYGGCGGSKNNNADNGASGGGAGANSSSVPGSGIYPQSYGSSTVGYSGGTGVTNGGGGGGGGYSGPGGNGSTIGGNGGTGYVDYMFLNGQSFSGGGGGFTIGFNSGGGLGVYGGGNGALGGTTVGPTNGTNGGGGGGGFNTGNGSTGGNGSAYFRQAYSF